MFKLKYLLKITYQYDHKVKMQPHLKWGRTIIKEGIKFSGSKINTLDHLSWNGQIHRQYKTMRHLWTEQNFRFSYTELVLGTSRLPQGAKKNPRGYIKLFCISNIALIKIRHFIKWNNSNAQLWLYAQIHIHRFTHI